MYFDDIASKYTSVCITVYSWNSFVNNIFTLMIVIKSGSKFNFSKSNKGQSLIAFYV